MGWFLLSKYFPADHCFAVEDAVSGVQAGRFELVSAPGTALLITLFPAITLNQAVGAYITAAVIIFLIGVSGSFDRIMRRIPPGIAAGGGGWALGCEPRA